MLFVVGTYSRGVVSHTGYWLLVGRRDTQELLGFRRVPFVRQTSSFEVPVQLPAQRGTFGLDLFLISDCYLGMDQQYAFDVMVA